MAVVPSKATITGTVSWSNGVLFDGWLLLGIVRPENADGQWPSTVLAGQLAPQRLPIWLEIPISAGVIDTATKVFFNSSIEPPNTQYVAFWYDRNKRRLFPATGVAPTPFTISTDPYAITVPTLTIPSTSATLPTPSEVPTVGV